MPDSPMTPAERYKQWFIDTAARLRADNRPPRTAREAERRGAALRARIRAAEGDWPSKKAPLDPQILGTLERDGYRVERLLFQTWPGCYVTANTYVPAGKPGPFPAVLCVHGHWAQARVDPVVQARCIGLAKLGYFVLVLDAWGAGERGTHVGQAEYHGGLLGASLWPVGTPLHGMQLYDNVRALDYLQSRPEVIADRIGCTGASGGGNQTTYLSAFDERVKCAVPVCSVGTFRSYLDTASCVDEVLLGGLTFAEEGDLLGMVAPRALMVISATRDVYHFSPPVAAEALDRARPYFAAHGVTEHVRHTLIESGHDYNRAMREAMYGWMTRWLKGEGDGSPIAEPGMQLEDPATIRCFPSAFRPGRVMTTVQWVRQRAEELAANRTVEAWSDAGARRKATETLRNALSLNSVGSFTPPLGPRSPLTPAEHESDHRTTLLETEAGVVVPLSKPKGRRERIGPPPSQYRLLLVHPGGNGHALQAPLLATGFQGLHVQSTSLGLRGCGELALPNQGLGNGIPDHNLVEWSLWIGRPLLGQWVHDILYTVAREPEEIGGKRTRIVLVGWRDAALAALLAGALSANVAGVVAIEPPASFITSTPPHNQRMAIFNPDLLKVGDIPQLAALAAPRPVLIANPVRLDGMPVPQTELESVYRFPCALYQRLGHRNQFIARSGMSDAEIAQVTREWLQAP